MRVTTNEPPVGGLSPPNLSRDPGLTSERGRAVRLLLRLFERAAAMKTLAAG